MKYLSEYFLDLMGTCQEEITLIKNMGLIGMPLDLIPKIFGPEYFEGGMASWTMLKSYKSGASHLHFDLVHSSLSFYYDSLGRLVRSVRDSSPGLSYDYVYHSNSQLKERSSLCASSCIKYDENGLIKESVYGSRTISYTYDAMGRLISRDSNDGDSRIYSYPSHNQVIITSDGQKTWKYLFDHRMRIIRRTDARGTVGTYDYDDQNNSRSYKFYGSSGLCITIRDTIWTSDGIISKDTFDGKITLERAFNKNGQIHAEIRNGAWPLQVAFEYHNGHLHNIYEDGVLVTVIPKF